MKNKILLIPLLVFLVLVGVLPAAAQSSEITGAELLAPEGQLTVGDPIELTLSVTHPADTQVIMPELAGDWGPFLVLSQSAPVTVVNADGTESTSQIIDARLFAPGSFSSPPLVVSLTDSQGRISEVSTEPLTVEISTVLVEGDNELRDIKPQVDTPYVNILMWTLVTLIVLLIAAAVLLFIRRRRSLRALAAVDNRLPHQVALDEFDRIEGLHLPDAGQFKEHYSLVSDTLRIYVEKRFEIPMMERTTGEIQEEIKRTELQPTLASQVLSLLDVSDLVKFSKYTPGATSAYAIITAARQIVQATISAAEEDTMPPNPAAFVPVSRPENSRNGQYQPTEVSA